MILLDTNVLMYTVGAPHPLRAPSRALLARVARREVEAAVDAEVLREILHRYRAIGRWEDGRRVYDLTRRLLPEVVDLGGEVLDLARQLMERHPRLTARDAAHAAAAILVGAEAFCTWDRDFLAIPELRVRAPDQIP